MNESDKPSDNTAYVQLPVDTSPKGLKTFTIDMDEYEMAETGTKQKNGKPVAFFTFKLIPKK